MGTADADLRFTDAKVCRNYLCGTCPHDLFSNTKMDLGPCAKAHLPRLKETYEAAVDRGEAYPQIVAEYQRNIYTFVADMDRKISANKRRLDQTPEEMERFSAIMREIGEIEAAMGAATAEMETLGEQGHVEASLGELAKVEALKAEREEKEKELQTLQENSGASGHQKLRVCDVCGAYLSILDSDRRLADHFSGKVRAIAARIATLTEQLHLGYHRLRELVSEFEHQRKATAQAAQEAQAAQAAQASAAQAPPPAVAEPMHRPEGVPLARRRSRSPMRPALHPAA